LTATLSTMTLAIVSLECNNTTAILGIIHGTTIHSSESLVTVRHILNVFYWQHLKLR